jgi:lysyl-tRNA synthetase class 2
MEASNVPASSVTPVDENQIIAERRAKLGALRAQGQAFPNDFRRDALAADLHARYGDKSNEELEPLAIRATVAGRMLLKRVMGKASFATITSRDAHRHEVRPTQTGGRSTAQLYEQHESHFTI